MEWEDAVDIMWGREAADAQLLLEQQERQYWELWQAFNAIYGHRMEFYDFIGWMDARVKELSGGPC